MLDAQFHNAVSDLLCQGRGSNKPRIGQNTGKFLASKACRAGGQRYVPRDDPGHFLQALVAQNVAIVVVKPLELINVYKNQRQVFPILRMAFIFTVQHIIKLPPVGNAGQ